MNRPLATIALGLAIAAAGLGQSAPQSLLVTRIYGISASFAGECAPGVVDNRSSYTRQNNFHSLYAVGAGSWTVTMSYSDTACAAPFIQIGQITDVSNPPILSAIGYHPYISIVVTGSATATYAAAKDFFPGIGGITGAAGRGVPPGGTSGQVLAKTTIADYDTRWIDPAGGSQQVTYHVGSGSPVGGVDCSTAQDVYLDTTSANLYWCTATGVWTEITANAAIWGNIGGDISLQADVTNALNAKSPLGHTHAIGDVLNLATSLSGKLDATTRGAANGVAPLDSTGKVPLANLPSASGITAIVQDTAPQLGGALDMNGYSLQTVTPAEMARVHNVTSPIQTQLNGKEPIDATILRQANFTGSGVSVTPSRSDHNHSGVYAVLQSPAFTGIATAPTASQGDNSLQIATTAYVDTGLFAKVALVTLTTLGDLPYRGASTWGRLAGNTSASRALLCQTGTGTISAAPAWCTIADLKSEYVPNTGASADVDLGTHTLKAGGILAPAGTLFSWSGTEGAKPTAPASGDGNIWFDSTDHLPHYQGNAGTVLGSFVAGIANPSDTQVVNYVDKAGVQHRIAQSGGGVGGGPNPSCTIAGATTCDIPGVSNALTSAIPYCWDDSTSPPEGFFPSKFQATDATTIHVILGATYSAAHCVANSNSSGFNPVVATFDTTAGTCSTTGGTGTNSCVATAGPPITLTITHNLNDTLPFASAKDSGGVIGSAISSITYPTANSAVFTFSQAEAGTAKVSTGGIGVSGTSPAVSIGTVTTGAAGTSATVTNSGTSTAPVFNFAIPQGANGSAGSPGGSAGQIEYNVGGTSFGGFTMSGDATINTATGALTLAANAVTSAKMAVVNTRRTVCLTAGTKNATAALADTDLADSDAYFIPAASTVVEATVHADAGTPNVIIGRDRAGSVLNLTSAALATATAGAIACSNTGGTVGLDAATTCSATLQNTGLVAGDWLKLVSGTAGGTAKQMAACITFVVN